MFSGQRTKLARRIINAEKFGADTHGDRIRTYTKPHSNRTQSVMYRVLGQLACLCLDLCVVFVVAVERCVRYVLAWMGVGTIDSAALTRTFEHETGPVLFLLHGSGSNESQFIVAQHILRDLPVATINFQMRRDDPIQVAAQQLRNDIEKRQIRRVVLVGMSMGGLVAAYYAERLAASANVKVERVITISTPFQGATLLKQRWLSAILNTTRHRQMNPGSVFLQELNAHIARSSIPYRTFGSTSDLHVFEECSYPDPEPVDHHHCCCTYPGHIAITLKPNIYDGVRAEYMQTLTLTTNTRN